MIRPFCFLLIVSFLFSGPSALGRSFGFDVDEEKWYFWGEGLGSHQNDQGHLRQGSLWLSTDFGETQTAHYHFSGLVPGTYKVKAHVRARHVRRGPEGQSFWHFYDGGEGTKTVFEDLHGSYGWRKVEYSLKTAKGELSLWFRLKSAGQVWIDDISLEKTDLHDSAPFIDPPKKIDRVPEKKEEYVANKNHPFKLVNATKLQIKSGKYYNFDPHETLNGDWRQFDRLEMEVHNGTKELYQLYLVLGDNQSNNYWSQLNHKTSLAPGVNKLSFDLRQYIGERGSHRFHRPLDLRAMKKMFIVLDPDGHKLPSDNFVIEKMSLVALPPPKVPQGILAFDFTSHKARGRTSLTRITSQHEYDPDTGYGFIDPKFWRVEDSIYASENLRYSIGILSGKFRVKVPNGKYKYSLVMEKLGLWDPPFWRNRTVYINGMPVFKEARSTSKDYLDDLLRFESTVPEEDDHPYDLYLSQIMKPVEGTAGVTNGTIEFEFEGDPSGISLNTLVLWNTKDEKKARGLLASMRERDKLEFDWTSRKVQIKASVVKGVLPALVAPALDLVPTGTRGPIGEEIKLLGGAGERPFALIQLPYASEVTWELSPLKDKSGNTLSKSVLTFNELVYQYTSPDLNHETYMVVGKYFRPIKTMRLVYSRPQTRYVSIQASLENKHKAGTYHGNVLFTLNGKKKSFPVTISVMPYQLPRIDFPVGFFGLDPVPFNYFKDPGMAPLRQSYRLKALKKIADSGFTTFTGLPSVGNLNASAPLEFDTSELDELFMAAASYGLDQPVFSYGGQFPNELFTEEMKPMYPQLAVVLKKLMERPFWPKIVHTFSDEAHGYSDRIKQDIEKGQALKRHFPFLPLGGFGSMKDKDTKNLNALFDFGFYSEPTVNGTSHGKWGSYNASPGNFQDPRFTFGPGLFLAREKGLSAYLEWHLTGFNNYPYYDLDGRESDVSMFMPGTNGELYSTLRFELATEGIQGLRKLMFLKDLIERKEGSTKYLTEANRWLQQLRERDPLTGKNFLSGDGKDINKFYKELNQNLSRLTGEP